MTVPSARTTSLSTCVSGLTRRRFLQYSGVAAAGTLATGCTSPIVGVAGVLAATAAAPRSAEDGVLVVVTLYGGNDGLNTVIPAGDPVYQNARRDLAYQPHEVLDLGEGLGLNPGLVGLKGLWDGKNLAVVRGVGYPTPDHSHFRSMAIWQTGSPTTSVPSGWLGRWLDSSGSTDPLRAVSIDPVMPPLMAGTQRSAASFPPGGLQLPRGAAGSGLAALGDPCAQDSSWQAAAARAISEIEVISDALEPAVATARQTDSDPAAESTEQQGATTGGRGALDVQLGLVAAMIEMGAPTRAYSVSLGGFDTHSDERDTQQRLLGELDGALTAFQQRMSAHPLGHRVVTMVYSEFGRRVTANGSDGTDHGTAGPMFVLGDQVLGGFHGDEPSLSALHQDDLSVTTDFRDVYGTMLQGVLGADPARTLDGWTGHLDGLLRA